jgi:hypothetical protein
LDNFGENGIATGWKPGQVIIPTMGKEYTFTLNKNEVGQLLDGLSIRAESWERTAEYLRSGSMPEDEIFLIEECSDPAEAEGIAEDYRSIIKKISSQIEPQQ